MITQKNLTLFVIGVLVLSPLSSYIILDLLLLPLYVPELLLLPFIFLLRSTSNRILKVFINRKVFIYFCVATFFIVWLAVYSVFFNQLGAYSTLSTARGYLYLIIAAIISYHMNAPRVKELWLVTAGVMVGTLLCGELVWQSLQFGETARIYPNMPALYILVISGLLTRQPIIIVMTLLLAVGVAFESGVRRPLIPIGAGLVGYLLLVGKKKRLGFQRRIRALLAAGGAIAITLVFLPTIIRFFSPNEYQYSRLVDRAYQLFLVGELDNSDSHRLRSAQMVLSAWDQFWIPKGFIAKQTSITGRGLFTDFPIYEFFYMLGSIPALILFSFLSLSFFRAFRAEIRKPGLDADSVASTSGLLFAGLLLVSGTFLHFTYEVVFTGWLLGRVFVLAQKGRRESRTSNAKVPKSNAAASGTK